MELWESAINFHNGKDLTKQELKQEINTKLTK